MWTYTLSIAGVVILGLVALTLYSLLTMASRGERDVERMEEARRRQEKGSLR